MESGSKGKQLMSKYRKTMAQAMNEGAIAMQIATLKKAYEPMRNKRISLDNANKLSQIFNRFDSNKEMLKQLYKADIPFVSAVATSRLISKHNMKAQELMQIRKEGIETATNELKEINELLSEGTGTIKGFRDAKEKSNMVSLAKQHGLKVKDVTGGIELSGNKRKILDMQLASGSHLKTEKLEEGKMSEIDAMQKAGKSAAEIAKVMKLPVKTVKSILGEEEIHEFKKMTVTINPPLARDQAIRRLKKVGLVVTDDGSKTFKVDGKGADLNKYAIDLKNFYKADIRAESYTIDESADEDNYNPITEACWVGYKKVGMKKKGDKMVPNCVPESVQEEVDENAPSAADMDRLKKQGMKPKKEEEEEETKPEVKKEKSDDKDKLKADIDKKDAEIQSLKVKAETEKAKTAKKETEKMVNPETGEPLLQVGIAYKHMRDKMKKEKEMQKEDTDYFKSKMNDRQIANIKNTWKNKKKSDVTPAIKAMIKKMDVPTQLAIKYAGINLLSDLVEMKKDDAYAIGMAQAKKVMNDEPPLEKKTIKKGHEIADKILKKEETILEFSSQQIKQAYGIANDPRYKQGNYSGAVKAIEKLATGLSKHPDVQKVLKRTNENAEHPAKKVFEQIEGLKNKAEKSGMPYGILKKVYDRGMAAWRGGHRPGTTQQQWAFARVNSFITKSSGTWGGADKDLAAKVKGN
jgi:hypothetical protein